MITVVPSVRYCQTAEDSGESQWMVEVVVFPSGPETWSFSKKSPARTPVLPAALTVSEAGVVPTGVEILKGFGAPVLPKVQPDTVKAPVVWRKRRYVPPGWRKSKSTPEIVP